MAELILEAHSGIRWLVLLLAITGLVVVLIRLFQSEDLPRFERFNRLAYTITFDLQALLGLILLWRVDFASELWPHVGFMVLAVVAMHILGPMTRRTEGRKQVIRALFLYSVPLALVIVGLIANGQLLG